MAEIDTERLIPYLRKIAESASSSFPTYASSEDTLSALYVWCWERKAVVASIMRDAESWEKRLYHMISGAANKHLLKEDAAVHGYSEDDTFYYSTSVLKELLAIVWDYEDWQPSGMVGEPGMPRSKKLVNQGGDMIAMLSDVKRALERIDESHYNLIVWVYKYHRTLKSMAEEEEVTPQTLSERHIRALRALQKELGVKPLSDLQKGYSVRSRVGTAEALAVSERQYEG